MEILDIVYLKNLIKKITTGNVSIEKTQEGGLNFYSQKDTADENKVSFTKEELMGVGIKSISRDDNNNTILTYTNNETKNLGKWNGQNAKIEVLTDTDYNYTLKVIYYDSNNQLAYFNTPNLISKIEIKENENNTDDSYKIDIINTDDSGIETVTTSPELMPEKYKIKEKSDNTEYIYKLEIEKTRNDSIKDTFITPNLKAPVHEVKPNDKNNKYQFMMDIIKHSENGTTTVTTSNLRGNNIWEGIELVGDNIVFEVLSDDDINYTRINDLYINTKTSDLYLRTDRNNVNNTWEKIGNIRGIEGKDAYQVAVDDGFRGTRTEWLKSLMGESLGSQIVWEKPNIHDEATMLKVWYYYKTDSTKYGPGSAWLNRYDVPPTKDYNPGKYSFYNGINYLNFETSKFVLPALSGKDTVSFYVLHDEKNSKCISHMINLETGEDTAQGDWIEVTTSATLPEGSELITEHGDIIQYGNWVQTIYLGNSKDLAYECTISTGADISGFVTSEEFNNAIGSDDLKTDRIDVKGAINEILDMLKLNKNIILETNNKTLFEAVNELYRRKHIDCYMLEATDLLSHCLSESYKKLTTNFIYCYNCTGVPEGNNGYGYAMLVVSNDPLYRQILFFDPSNGKISINNIGANTEGSDFGSWSGWNSELTSNDLTKKVSINSTDNEVPTAKAVFDCGVPIGSIQPYYGTYYGLTIPDGWQLCDGSAITDADSPLNGKNTPDLRGRSIFGCNNGGINNSFGTIGKTGGLESVSLSKENLPLHRHDESYNTFSILSGPYDSWNTNPIPSGYTAKIMWSSYSTFGSDSDFSSGNNDSSNWGRNLMVNGGNTIDTAVYFVDNSKKSVGGSVGNNLAHENLPPYLTVEYIIKIK